MTALPDYEVFAARYATRPAKRSDHFIGGDPHDGPMPMDYFVWAVRNAERTLVVDTGFTEPTARARKRTFLRCPTDALRMVDIDAATVTDVVLTHMHYDHVGNHDKFPRARFHLQEREMAFATGRYMGYRQLGHGVEVEDVVGMVRHVFAGRVAFHDGAVEIAPGVTLHLVGGHTMGMQCVRVHTRRGFVVLASDVSHFYENMETDRPFVAAFNIGEMLEGFRTLERLAPSRRHIVPGHDPLVLARYPAVSSDTKDIVVRLDVDPA